MKRADIETGHVYGYNESTSHVHHYDPVLVLSTELYMIDRYSRKLGPADQYHQAMTSGRATYSNAVGLLVLFLAGDDLGTRSRAMAMANVEDAVAGINGELETGRDLTDGINAQTGEPVWLGRYGLLTSQRYLHGDYAELTAEMAESKLRSARIAQEQEEVRLAALARYRALEARLAGLSIADQAYVGDSSHPYSVRLSLDDMETLLDLAEHGKKMRAFDTHRD